MPVPVWFSDEPGLIEPRAFAAEIESEMAILCFSRKIFALLRTFLGLPEDRPAPRLPGAVDCGGTCFESPGGIGGLSKVRLEDGIHRGTTLAVNERSSDAPVTRFGLRGSSRQ